MQEAPPRLPFSIRPAEPADALCIAVLGLQVFLDTYATGGVRPTLAQEALDSAGLEAVTRNLARADVEFLLAERDGHLIGFAELEHGAAHPLAPHTAPVELRRLYVQERFTGQGVGRALLQQAEQAARDAGANGLWLTAWVGNARALAFYARQGYADRGETVFTFQGESHGNRLFARALG